MFKIDYIQGENIITLKSTENRCSAAILLSLGASLQSLKFDSKSIIKNLSPLEYRDTFASSILFPFTGRIKNGSYSFQGKDYQLDINQKASNMAIHGLIYNKEFVILNKETTKTYAAITLSYKETNITNGFPFKYTVNLNYTLKDKEMELKVDVINNDKNSFPFCIGWHPYFHSSNLYKSSLSFKSEKKIIYDENIIVDKLKNIDFVDDLQIKDAKLDDGYLLKSDNITFNTPDYSLAINSSAKENYLQLYTPPKENTIAIEPLTAPSNSFNNKIGLQVLNPNETYSVSYQIKLIDDA